MELMKRLINDEEGQDLVEYALIVGIISIVAVAAITTAGTKVDLLWDKVTTALSGIV